MQWFRQDRCLCCARCTGDSSHRHSRDWYHNPAGINAGLKTHSPATSHSLLLVLHVTPACISHLQCDPLPQYTIAMMGYGPEESNAVVELTYNYGVESYEKGNAYGQVSECAPH